MPLIYHIATFFMSFIVTLCLGKIAIPLLQRLKFGQEVRDDGPQKHLSKQGTPTMGGATFIVGTLAVAWAVSAWMSTFGGFPALDTQPLFFATVSMLGFGLIGFLDDIIKISKKRSLGLRAWQKILGQIALSMALALWYTRMDSGDTQLYLPWLDKMWDLGGLYLPFMVIFCIAVVNCVNLTDGLDGLSASVTLIDTIAYGVIYTQFISRAFTGNEWGIMGQTMAMQLFIASFAGALLAYLVYNVYPARMFMGDTGSFAMGGALSAMAIFSRTALWIPIIGVCFVASGVSVILQVGSFKLRGGKRIFKMAPLHHHFELLGYPETKVVEGYRIVTILACALMLTAF